MGQVINRRRLVANQDPLRLPLGKHLRDGLVRVRFLIQIEPDKIIGRSFVESFLFLRRDDIVGRSHDLRQITDFFLVVKNSTKRSDVRHRLIPLPVHCSLATPRFIAPMPSISAFKISPGVSVVTSDKKLICVAMSLIIASVLADCLSSPLIQSFIQRLCGSAISSLVVIHGPMGAKVSKPLRTLRVPDIFLLKPYPRAVTSSMIV